MNHPFENYNTTEQLMEYKAPTQLRMEWIISNHLETCQFVIHQLATVTNGMCVEQLVMSTVPFAEGRRIGIASSSLMDRT